MLDIYPSNQNNIFKCLSTTRKTAIELLFAPIFLAGQPNLILVVEQFDVMLSRQDPFCLMTIGSVNEKLSNSIITSPDQIQQADHLTK